MCKSRYKPLTYFFTKMGLFVLGGNFKQVGTFLFAYEIQSD